MPAARPMDRARRKAILRALWASIQRAKATPRGTLDDWRARGAHRLHPATNAGPLPCLACDGPGMPQDAPAAAGRGNGREGPGTRQAGRQAG
jgi:hypothetical protein